MQGELQQKLTRAHLKEESVAVIELLSLAMPWTFKFK
jgi:hypothetical protein